MCYCYGDVLLLWWYVTLMVMCFCYGDVLLLWWYVTVMVMCHWYGDVLLLWWFVTVMVMCFYYGDVLLLWWYVTVMVMCFCYGDVLLLWWYVTVMVMCYLHPYQTSTRTGAVYWILEPPHQLPPPDINRKYCPFFFADFKIISFRVSIYSYNEVSLQSKEVSFFPQLDTYKVSPLMCHWLTILDITFNKTPKGLSRKLNSKVSTWLQLSTELRNKKLHKKCALKPFKCRKHKNVYRIKYSLLGFIRRSNNRHQWRVVVSTVTDISGGFLWAQ